MKFTKMQGIGNDYVYVNCFKENVEDPAAVSRMICDRHFGIGSDGLVLIMPSSKSDFKMRMFNPDGSESEMCGNAVRCIAKYVYDYGLTKKTEIALETLAGEKKLKLIFDSDKVKDVEVDMGEPILCPKDIPIISDKDLFVSQPIEVEGNIYSATGVSMGNPHIVVYVDDVDAINIENLGPKFENNEIFPNRINTEFVNVINRTTLKMRVWERGTGETLACGTGACAVLVASVLNGFSERSVTVELLGGDLKIEWNEINNHVYMTGPAVKVFDGEIEV